MLCPTKHRVNFPKRLSQSRVIPTLLYILLQNRVWGCMLLCHSQIQCSHMTTQLYVRRMMCYVHER